MTPILPIFLLAFAHPSLTAGDNPLEVVRSGDAQMSCEQLSKEIAALQAATQGAEQRQAERESRSRMTKGLLTGALSVAPALVGGKLGGGVITQYALSGVLQNAQASPALAVPPTGAASAEGRRVSHLSELYREKGC